MKKSEPAVCYRAFGRDIYGPAGLSLSLAPAEGASDDLPALQLRRDDALRVSITDDLPPLLHDVEDYPGGPKFYVWKEDEGMGVQYDRWRTRLMIAADRIDFADLQQRALEVVDVERREYESFRFSLAMERVFLPLYALFSMPDAVGLHGSAIVLKGRAYLFIGRSGAGKSTTAYEFVRRGARLLADDLIVADLAKGIALGGAPTLRLWKGEGALPEAKEDRSLWQHDKSKRWFRIPAERGAPSAVPIGAIIMLDPDSLGDRKDVAPALEISSQREGLTDLLGQTFDLTNAPEDWMVSRFRNAARLVREYPFYHFRYVKSADGQPAHIDALFKAIAGLNSQQLSVESR